MDDDTTAAIAMDEAKDLHAPMAAPVQESAPVAAAPVQVPAPAPVGPQTVDEALTTTAPAISLITNGFDDSWVVTSSEEHKTESWASEYAADSISQEVEEMPPPPPAVPPPPLTPPLPSMETARLAPLCIGEILPKDIEAELVEAAMEDQEEDFEFETNVDNAEEMFMEVNETQPSS